MPGLIFLGMFLGALGVTLLCLGDYLRYIKEFDKRWANLEKKILLEVRRLVTEHLKSITN